MDDQPACYLLHTGSLDSYALPDPLNARPFPDIEQDPVHRLHLVATALAGSPGWEGTRRAVIVVRQSPTPALALLGHIDSAQKIQLQGLRWQLKHVLPRIRYVDYEQAETDCEALAEKLIQRFGRQELSRFHWAAIPRGGLIVLGMLAYVLDLEPRQLHVDPNGDSPDVPLVVVDDCAISGARFGRELRRINSTAVCFAHLYSHPGLRRAIEEQEARVLACVAARDLRDHAPDDYGGEYEDWKDRWQRRPRSGYWIGQPDHVCFAWNEPDITLWNPDAARPEPAVRLLPPEYCLKNRRRAPDGPAIQLQPEGRGTLRPSANTVFGELEGQVVVADIAGGASFVLSGAAGDMWQAILETESLDEAEQRLAQAYRVDPTTLHSDFMDFVSDLRHRNVLEEYDRAASL